MVDDRDDEDAPPTFRHEKTRLGLGDLPLRAAPSLEIEIVREPAKPLTLDEARYTLGPVLGEGGMGEVLLARDEHIGRDVAIKRIRSESPSEETVARFVREARVQGRLEHPAVVPVYDLAADSGGRPYFVMKRLAGTDMHELLRRMRTGEEHDEPGARRRLLRAFADVCLAIQLAHERSVIHRDLKPANIMLGEYGEVYVLDWGVARDVGAPDDDLLKTAPRRADSQPMSRLDLVKLDTAETQQGALLGTPAYMAPEQLAGDPVGPSADVYALGCILFEIAAGEPLHPRTRTVGQALSLADARPSTRRPDSPPELDAICLRATAIEPEDRFPTARALGAAVQAYLDGNRDVAVRRELAQQHLIEACAAIARGNDEADRIAALRAAGRALALDPTSTEAGDVVTSIMLQPPRTVPAEVERELVALETVSAQQQGRLAAISLLGYLAFVPFLIWTGISEPLIVVAMCALAIFGSAHIHWFTRKARIPPEHVYLNAAINAVLIACVVRMVGPFIIAPTLVIATLMGFAAHQQFGRIGIISCILAAGVAVLWLLEKLGVLAPTYSFVDGKVMLGSPTLTFEPAPTQVSFLVLLVMFVAVVAYLLRTMAIRQRVATRRLELQAWHLRQIVPAGVPSDP